MFKNILAAFDGSDHAEAAMAVACNLANTYNATLHMVSAPQAVGETMVIGYSAVPLPPSSEALEKASQKTIDKANDIAAAHGIQDHRVHVEGGDPGRVIVEYANANDVDLIVLGRRGLGNLGGLLVGSTTNRVAQLADCAVLTVK